MDLHTCTERRISLLYLLLDGLWLGGLATDGPRGQIADEEGGKRELVGFQLLEDAFTGEEHTNVDILCHDFDDRQVLFFRPWHLKKARKKAERNKTHLAPTLVVVTTWVQNGAIPVDS